VTHITLSKKTTAKPCLEFYSDGAGEARRVTIENYPFRIGRAESADLRVESVEVSREHAEITERNGMWLVRDLGSTNGTQVNGKPIQEMVLADGDILRVAETEMTFIASAASQFQRMVTQPIQSRKVAPAPYALPP
jgi:pSer/pThr/pTyr-binding forkhead associated (FHA) protein